MKIKSDLLQQLIQDNAAGRHSFPEHLAKLFPLGINSYQIDLEHGKAHYFGEKESELVYDLPLEKKLVVGSTWSQEGIKEAIHRVQMKELNYPQFLEAIAKAGVKRYTVDLLMKMTIYFGSSQEVIEPFPSLLCTMLNHLAERENQL